MKFGLTDEHIRKAHIRARIETADAGSRVTATRAATMGVVALAAKKKRPDAVTLIVIGDDYSSVVDCSSGKRAREQAELFAARINAISGRVADPAKEPVTEAPTSHTVENPLSQLKQLAELRDAGAITSDDFEAKKAELLRRV